MATTVPETSSAIIDERRAQQLMERAMNLAERNDLASAVLACRQAIALSPQAAQSYSMLGLLLERAGDTTGAISAYEKVLEFAPDSFLERESLGRLRGAASQRQNTREMFAFDDNELFGESNSANAPTAKNNAGSTPGANREAENSPDAAAIATAQIAPGANDGARNTTVSTASVAASTAAVAMPGAGSTPGSRATSPANSAAPNRANAAASNRSDSMPFPSTQPTRPANAGVGVPLDLPVPASRLAKQSAWQRLKRHPTPYFRGLPLAGATAIGLMFLLWANNYASSNRAINATPPTQVVAEDPFAPMPEPANSPSNPEPVTQPSAANPASPTAPTSTPVNPGAPSSATPTNPGAATAPGVPANVGAPAAPTNTAPVNTAPVNTGSTPGAPSGVAPAAPVASPSVVPADNGGSSAGGTPVSPAGAPRKEYVRVAPAGGNPVARPENRAATDERNARTDAQAGRSNAAIDNMSRAIESGGPDVALRYQQRAQLYLQNGDGARASSDFQAAISAYNDMIARGDRVAIARSGISACRRGLQMSQERR